MHPAPPTPPAGPPPAALDTAPVGPAGDPRDLTPVVHLCAEYWPFARTGGLAEAVRGIATYQAAVGRPTTVILPWYRSVREAFPEIRPTGIRASVPVGPRTEWGTVHEIAPAGGGVRVLFVEHAEYFERSGLYGEGGWDYPDNHLRFAFFCRFVTEVVLPRITSGPFVLHTHDWHTALAPVYLRTSLGATPSASRAATVLTVHNAGYQGHFGPEVMREVGLAPSLWDWRRMEWYGKVNVLKGGIVYSDMVTTVSPGHALELRTAAGGFGLHAVFGQLGDRLVGVLNGIDQAVWDPQNDAAIAAPYGPDDPSGKAVCKRWLQKALDLPVDPGLPLFGMVARMVRQKGLDIVLGSQAIGTLPAQFLFVGEGDPAYQEALHAVAARHPTRVATRFEFTEEREHRMIAGCDALLMPSQYEPCGLTQMRAQRYGTLPVVRSVGGLADTVDDEQNGFRFDDYSSEALDAALHRAVERHADRPRWDAMMRAAMRRDFSWPVRVREYDAVYRRALEGVR